MINIKKIEETLSRPVCGGWDRGFLESVLDQLLKGSALSPKQKQTLGKVIARNTQEAQREHEHWSLTYDKDYRDHGKILAAYHLRQPYHKEMARDILKGNIPQRAKFLRMYDNKYSKKVIAQHQQLPKYAVGDYLMARTSLASYKQVEFESDSLWANENKTIQNFKKRGGFVLGIRGEIYSAAKGAKRYKLLPVGETTPIIIEERFLKKSKKKE